MIAPAPRVGAMRPSPIRQLARGAPPGSISLGLGEPTWPLPEPARRALAGAPGPCAYGPNAGLADLRGTVADRYGVTGDEVLITTGSTGGLYALLQAWIGPGDKILAPDPGFVAYRHLGELAGGQTRTYPLDGAFRLDAEALIRRLDEPGLKVVLLNLPSNPTGGGASREALGKVARACEERGILLVSDEVYRELYLEGRAPLGPPPSLRDVSSWGVVASSVSKGWGGPGLRVGWLVGDPRWLAPALTVHAFSVTAAALPAQRAARALLESSDEVLTAARRELAVRWQALEEGLEAHLGVSPRMPDGAFYAWLPLPAAAREDPRAFCLQLRDEARVILVPGTVFGDRGRSYLRLSYAAEPQQIAEGLRRLAPFWSPS